MRALDGFDSMHATFMGGRKNYVCMYYAFDFYSLKALQNGVEQQLAKLVQFLSAQGREPQIKRERLLTRPAQNTRMYPTLHDCSQFMSR